MFRRLVPCALLAVLVAGCGSKIDGDSVEKELLSSYGDRGYPGLAFECPDPDNEVGERFECEMRGLKGYTRVVVEVGARESIAVIREL